MYYTLNAQDRKLDEKPKQLRRNGLIPGILYGKDLNESLSIQVSHTDAARFLKSNATGSRTELVIGERKYHTLLREVSYTPASGELEHLSFQTLLAGEVVNSTAWIVLVNKEKVMGVVHQPQVEISYRALPAHLIEKIEIDLEGMQVGDSIKISDLDIAKDPNIEILNPLDSMVISVADTRRPAEASETEDEASEVPVE